MSPRKHGPKILSTKRIALSRVRRRIALGTALGFLFLMFGCVAPRGGWDVEAVAARVPAIGGHSGHRLGDLVPFPVLIGDSLQLVACRFPIQTPVIVDADEAKATLQTPSNPEAQASIGHAADQRAGRLAREAVQTLSGMIPSLDLRLSLAGGQGTSGEPPAEASPPATIVILPQPDSPGGPRNALGETVSECDISRDASGAIRGRLIRAQIRMGTLVKDNQGRPRPATEAEWLGALMHELGHSLGFVGHVSLGESLMVRERSVLRRWGRRVLEGRALEPDATLSAFYALSPGEVLGTRELDESSRQLLGRMRALHKRRVEAGDELTRVVSMAGDRDARIEWRYAKGARAGLWFRGWAAGLRGGGAMQIEADFATRRDLIAEGL